MPDTKQFVAEITDEQDDLSEMYVQLGSLAPGSVVTLPLVSTGAPGPTRFRVEGPSPKYASEVRIIRVTDGEEFDYPTTWDVVDVTTAWDVIGIEAEGVLIKVVGGRTLYEDAIYYDDTPGTNVKLARLDTSGALRQVNRYVDPDTRVQLVKAVQS